MQDQKVDKSLDCLILLSAPVQLDHPDEENKGSQEPDSWTSVRESDTPFTQDFNVQTLIEEQTEALVV